MTGGGFALISWPCAGVCKGNRVAAAASASSDGVKHTQARQSCTAKTCDVLKMVKTSLATKGT